MFLDTIILSRIVVISACFYEIEKKELLVALILGRI